MSLSGFDAPYLVMVCMIVILLGVILLAITIATRIVPEYARMAIFRLGRFVRVVGPGLIFLLPFVDRGIQVDLREQKETINTEVSTQDNARVNVQMSLGYRIVEPEKSILNVPYLTTSVREATRNRLKSIIGSLTYGDIIHDRARIESELKNRLVEGMVLWGCEVISVEILEIHRN